MIRARLGQERDTREIMDFLDRVEQFPEQYQILDGLRGYGNSAENINRRLVRQSLFSDDFKVLVFEDCSEDGKDINALVIAVESSTLLLDSLALCLIVQPCDMPPILGMLPGAYQGNDFPIAKLHLVTNEENLDLVGRYGLNYECLIKAVTKAQYIYSIIY